MDIPFTCKLGIHVFRITDKRKKMKVGRAKWKTETRWQRKCIHCGEEKWVLGFGDGL